MTLIATAVRLAENPNIPGTGVTPKCDVPVVCKAGTDPLFKWLILVAIVCALICIAYREITTTR